MSLEKIKKELLILKNTEKARHLQRFFKTSPGEYGEGDVFLGITVPEQRRVVKKYLDLSLEEIEGLLHSKYHEFRLTALIILVEKIKKAKGERRQPEADQQVIKNNEAEKAKKDEMDSIYKFYLRNAKWVNNWDLVDLSAPYIVGGHLLEAPSRRGILYKLAKSDLLWERRIGMVATLQLIREGDFSDVPKLSKLLLKDNHDLMHKAVGWCLREMGKKSVAGLKELYKFLDQHTLEMPRTMLRYAIERLPEKKRKYYLNLGK